jgi:hypothetical protein
LKNAADGQVLAFDAASGKWIASDNYGGAGSGGTDGGGGDAIGPRGYRGSQGTAGFVGSKGFQGFSGSKGNIGFAGSTGFNGNDGFVGSQGIGEKGSSGFAGSIGYAGSKGDATNPARIINYNYNGDGESNTFVIEGGYIANSVVVFLNGVKQIVGYDVFIDSGSTVNFTDPPPIDFVVDVFGYQESSIVDGGGGTGGGGNGYTGSKGDSGAFSGRGFSGSLGFSGSIGSDGIRGLPGFIGSMGYVGSHGLQGEKGDIGPQGEQGFQGDPGLQGEPGPVGNDGTRGPRGYFGSTGYYGSQGIVGYVGSYGDLGYVGSQGDLGYVGSQGDLGYAGSQGIPGEYAALGYTGSGGAIASDRITSNGYEVVLASTGQLNIPSADNTEGGNARIQSSANIDILSNLSIWTFGTDSVLTTPEHGKIVFNSADPEQYIEGTQGFHIHASDGVSIDVGANTYSFGNDGAFTTSRTMNLPVLTVEPSYPTAGMMAVSDGTDWNPFDTGVENLVIYLNNSWVKLG